MRANLASIALALAWSSIDAEGGLDLQEWNLLDDVWLCPSGIKKNDHVWPCPSGSKKIIMGQTWPPLPLPLPGAP